MRQKTRLCTNSATPTRYHFAVNKAESKGYKDDNIDGLRPIENRFEKDVDESFEVAI